MGKDQYVAFLRGINLGNRNIKMQELGAAFSSLGFSGVQTILATGNVVFESGYNPDPQIISRALWERFGFEVGVILRSVDQLEALVDANPFGSHADQKDVKLYHTLCATEIGTALEGVKDQPGDFSIAMIKSHDYFSIAYRQPSGRFGAGLDKLERLFKGQLITTRNWNTMLKIIKKARTK